MIKRGVHDIRNEITFTANPSFVFHDSCGFEAGSSEEFQKIKDFIVERSARRTLAETLHAIWYHQHLLPTHQYHTVLFPGTASQLTVQGRFQMQRSISSTGAPDQGRKTSCTTHVAQKLISIIRFQFQ